MLIDKEILEKELRKLFKWKLLDIF
jgi:hypothetical protein